MKNKTFGLLFLLIASSVAFAGADDTLVSFSTKGPDTYLDGTTVRDGECYALVWTRTGASFEGLAADGAAVGTNSRVVVFAPVAKGGRCPPVLFELDAALAKSYAGGAFAVYLLDTRLASGAVGGVKANGAPVAVNGWGAVDAKSVRVDDVDAKSVRVDEDEESSSDGRGGDTASTGRGKDSASTGRGEDTASAGTRIAVTAKSALPANTPQPRITAIRLVGDNVILTVKGTLPCLQYKAVDALSVRVGGEDEAATPAQGANSVDEEITIIAPKKGERGLYSVRRD